jgi:hypothetical protein
MKFRGHTYIDTHKREVERTEGMQPCPQREILKKHRICRHDDVEGFE